MPGLPGVTTTSAPRPSTWAKACSRPPEPITQTRIVLSYHPRVRSRWMWSAVVPCCLGAELRGRAGRQMPTRRLHQRASVLGSVRISNRSGCELDVLVAAGAHADEADGDLDLVLEERDVVA